LILEDGKCKVQSSSNPETWYEVDVEEETCTCPHHTYRQVKCKHIKDAQREVEKKFAEKLRTGKKDEPKPEEEEIPDDPFNSVWGTL